MVTSQQMLHVLTDKRGKIIGAAVLPAGDTTGDGVHVQMVPLKGQSLVAVPASQNLGPLETEEDFRRLVATFHLPAGKKALAPKRAAKGRKKRRTSS